MEQQPGASVVACEPGNRCPGCPMIGQSEDVRAVVARAIEKIYTEHNERQWANPVLAAIVTPSALYESGIHKPSREQLVKVRMAVQKIAIRGECFSYWVDDNHSLRRRVTAQ